MQTSLLMDDTNANRGPAVVAVCWVLLSFLATTLILRFVSRKLSRAGFWWDDWLALLCLVRVLVVTFDQGALKLIRRV